MKYKILLPVVTLVLGLWYFFTTENDIKLGVTALTKTDRGVDRESALNSTIEQAGNSDSSEQSLDSDYVESINASQSSSVGDAESTTEEFITSSDVSLQSKLLSSTDGAVTYYSNELEKLDFEQINIELDNLTYSEKSADMIEKEQSLEQSMAKLSATTSSIQGEKIACNDSLCGVLFSSNNKQDVVDSLNSFTSPESFISQNIYGGSLMIYNEQDRVYGLVLGVSNKNKKITISSK